MEIMRKVGFPIRLRLSLSRDETTKFVKAFLTSSSGASITDIALTHLANGIYGENSYLMPNLESVEIKYRVYIDSGYTVLDQTYQSAYEVIRREDPSDVSDGSIFNLLGGADVEGYVEEESEFTGSVEETAELS